MACGDGCCGGDEPVLLPPIKVPRPAKDAETEDSRCCADNDADADADACCDDECLRLVALQDCVQDCVTSVLDSTANESSCCCPNTGNDACCGDAAVVKPTGCCSAGMGSCSAKESTIFQPQCNQDDTKQSIQALGVVQNGCYGLLNKPETGDGNRHELRSECYGTVGLSDKTCCSKDSEAFNDRTTAVEPCENHLEAARRRYSNMFGAMSCLCRALLAQGRESCCTTKRKLSAERISNAPTSRRRDKCSSTKPSASSSAVKLNFSNTAALSSRRAVIGGGSRTTTAESRCLDEKGCIDGYRLGCCKSEDGLDAITPTKALGPKAAELHGPSNDLEKGNKSTEHIVLSVQGMTCTGCETKLQRSIAAIASAANVQTSIILSRAEFDVDPHVTTVDHAIVQLERATGFVLTRLCTTGRELQVFATADNEFLFGTNMPQGVLDIRCIDDDTIGIFYDANIVGARDLLKHVFDVELQLAPLRPAENILAGIKHVRQVGLMTVLSAALTIPVLVFAWAPLPPNQTAYQSASLALATFVQIVIAGPFYGSALRSLLFSRVIEMDLLIVMSTSAAYVFSVVAYAYSTLGRPLSTGQFFESSTLLVTLIMVGRFISAFARQKAVESISITSLQPTMAALVDAQGSDVEEIDSRLLHYSDIFKVLPESRIVTDGTVISGASEVDESMITGESQPVVKHEGSSVVAGSVNGSGLMHVKVARLPGENTISSIAEMVDQAKLSKPKIQELADKVAGYFVPTVCAITAVVFCVWIGIGTAARHQSGSEAVVKAITYAIAVLIVSCPCAVGLAVPMVIVISCGVGAEHGVVFKSSQSIESSWRATHVVFDKTGTLTQGKAIVVREENLSSDHDVDSLLLGLVNGNKHPSSMALVRHLMTRKIEAISLESLDIITGCGVEGRHAGKVLRVGSAKWLGLEQLDQVQSLQDRGLTTLCFTIDGKPQAVYGLADALRSEANSVVSALISRGIVVSIVSGDDSGPVKSIGLELGLDPINVKSRCSPLEKQRYIQNLTQDKKNIVIFCGDGSNDAGALAQATVGVHMSEGTDVARSASDAVLMRPDISGLLTLMDISHAAYHRVSVNFAWAGVYNLFAILFAAGAFVDIRVPPQYAGLGEVVSVLPVILIALQMRWAKF